MNMPWCVRGVVCARGVHVPCARKGSAGTGLVEALGTWRCWEGGLRGFLTKLAFTWAMCLHHWYPWGGLGYVPCLCTPAEKTSPKRCSQAVSLLHDPCCCPSEGPRACQGSEWEWVIYGGVGTLISTGAFIVGSSEPD